MQVYLLVQRTGQFAHTLLKGHRAQIEHPEAALEMFEARFSPVGSEGRDRAVAFAIVVIALERGRMGHRDAAPSTKDVSQDQLNGRSSLRCGLGINASSAQRKPLLAFWPS